MAIEIEMKLVQLNIFYVHAVNECTRLSIYKIVKMFTLLLFIIFYESASAQQLPPSQRAALLLQQMTLDEKLSLVHG